MNLKELARQRGTNIKQVAEKCGIPASTLYAISRGDTNLENVGIDTVIKVAGALGMTAEELYLGPDCWESMKRDAVQYSETHSPFDELAISTIESELIGLFRSMNAHGREQLMVFARGCAASYPKNQASEMGA